MARRIVGIIVAVLLAAVGTLVLVGYVRTAEQRALAGELTVAVLVVAEEIPAGTPAEELGSMVRTERVPAKVQAIGSVEGLDELAGLAADVTLLPGEQITRQRFVVPGEVGAVEVPEGLLEVTVALEPERALGGQLDPGSLVGIIASFTEESASTTAAAGGEGAPPVDSGSEAITHLLLHKVLVTNVQGNQSAAAGGVLGANTTEAGDNAVPADAVLVTLALDAPSVERVVFAAEHGSLWLSAEPEDAPEDGTSIQTRETILQ